MWPIDDAFLVVNDDDDDYDSEGHDENHGYNSDEANMNPLRSVC